jgi:chromosome segregation ATPase
MTEDIVARLRAWSADESTWDLLKEAADEIERLKNQISHIIEHNNPQIENANSHFKFLEDQLARCNKIIDEYEEEHSELRAALHEWDALIRHQYSGSQEAMSDMTYAAQHTAHLLYGDDPWPEPRRTALGEKTDD